MNELSSGTSWVLHTILGGGLLLLLGWLLVKRIKHVAIRQRVGECALLAALLLSALSLLPSAWRVRLPIPQEPFTSTLARVSSQVERVLPSSTREFTEGWTQEKSASPTPRATREQPSTPHPAHPIPGGVLAIPPAEDSTSPLPPVTPQEARESEGKKGTTAFLAGVDLWNWLTWKSLPDVFFVAYLGLACMFWARWLLGHMGLWYLLRRTEPIPERVRLLYEQLTAQGPRPRKRVRLVISRRTRVPFSCGLWRRTVVLPFSTAEDASEEVLRWVLLHELTHLDRRDAWASWLFGLGQGLFFFLPWFWWIRRQVRLCQEYIADSAAGREQPEEYAECLLNWAVVPAGKVPVGATGVSDRSSDLYRRITMLLKNAHVDARCPRGWLMSVVAGTLVLAVLGASIGLRAAPVPKPTKKDTKKDNPTEEKKPSEKAPKRAPTTPNPILPPNLDDLTKGLDPEMAKRLRKQLEKLAGPMKLPIKPGATPEDIRKAMEEMQKEMARNLQQLRGLRFGMGPGFGGPGAFAGRRPQGRLGVLVAVPTPTLANQLDLPRGQGLIIERVISKSAAEKAGLKTHDILLEVDGKKVSHKPFALRKMLRDIKADKAIDLVIMRKGRKQTIKGVKLPKAPVRGAGAFPGAGAPAFPAFPRFAFPNAGKGASTSVVRNNDEFTTRHREGDLKITVTGKVEGNKAKVEEIRIEEGTENNTYKEVTKVPEKYRTKVEKLIDMSGRGGVRVAPKPKPGI